MNSLQSSVSIGPHSKFYKMKQLIKAIELYLHTKREDTAMIINMHLQGLGVTIDLSVFDPHSIIAPQFFVSLYELMNKMEFPSPFAWNCVDVLSNACRNPAARHDLIHTYQFIPSLSRLLSDQLSVEKKIRLLRLMQDLTCGIRISWQIPHLPHLIVTLGEWIESSNNEIVTLSMGILVNLCYKNLPAIYTLLGNVDVKKILNISSRMQGPTVEIHTCKLLIILDYMNGDIPENVLEKLVNVTFVSVIEAFRVRDSVLLRQIIEFLLDVGKQNSLKFLMNVDCYREQVTQLLEIIQNNSAMETDGDSAFENRDPECLAQVFEFLNFLVETKLAVVTAMFPVLIEIALKWIHTDLVSSQALALLKTVAVNVPKDDNVILKPIVQGLPIFLNVLETSRNGEGPDYIEQNQKISGMLQLLRIMVLVPELRPKVLEELKVETVGKIFGTLTDSEGTTIVAAKGLDMGNVETINLYVHGIALVNELARHDVNWMNLQTNLMQHKQTQMILAQCLCQSSKEEKVMVLEMSTVPCFPRKMVAEIMMSLQAISASDPKKGSGQNVQDFNFPTLSVAQIKKIDGLLGKLQESFDQKQFNSVLTSDVIELYEYKLASMGNAERAAMASVEAASERCTYLQHRNAQLTAELSRSHQLLYHVQQCHERVKENLSENVDSLRKQLDGHVSKLKAVKAQLTTREEELEKTRDDLEILRKKHEKLVDSKNQLEEHNSGLKQVVSKLEENLTRLESVVQKKMEALKKTSQTVEGLNSRVNELETCLTQKEGELHQSRVKLKNISRELEAKKQILETITKFASNSQVSESE